ncbi:hypothetical protein O71_22731 [Pontibacter sp. BAB1700]|nr:hypothetical protein O71_22731 [Pontibacter sp. BAB1700]
MTKLFDSSRWNPSAVLNYNYIYFTNLIVDRTNLYYDNEHIKPGFQLLYKENAGDAQPKAIDFQQLYICAIKHYDWWFPFENSFDIYFKCQKTLDIYFLEYPMYLRFACASDVESWDFEKSFAWRNKVTEAELRLDDNVTFHNRRVDKLTNLGF